MQVSVIIRVRNAETDLCTCLDAIGHQRVDSGVTVKVVVVDNASTDGSVAVAQQRGATVVSISTEEFTWGRALNRGIGAATSDVAVLLSADATPENEHWLTEMLRPFSNPSVAAVYGRQMPRRDAPVDEVVRLKRAFDSLERKLTGEGIEDDLRNRRWVCSNACAAVRTPVWHQFPFDEQVPASEEVPWIRAVLASGLHAVYAPRARVLHSHRESVLRSAIRTWEFYENSPSLRRRVWGPLRLVGALSKKRVRNCLNAGVISRSTWVGIGRLPAEVLAILLIAAIRPRAGIYERLRQRSRGG